jgi:hypothetical protein
VATPLFQQGEQVIRRGEATRYYKGKGGWSNTSGIIWLTNQRIVYLAGFGNQRNWPLDYIIKVQTGIIDTVPTVCIEFDNGMVEWFAVEEQRSWIEALQAATRKYVKPTPKPPTKPASADSPSKKRGVSRSVVMLAAAAVFGLCGCLLITLAAGLFLKVF